VGDVAVALPCDKKLKIKNDKLKIVVAELALLKKRKVERG